MADYETLRERHAAQEREQIPAHQERIAWPPERLREERERQLRTLVRVAKERSPWYRERLANIDAETLDESRLASIPPMTKADLMEHFDGILTDRRLTRDLVEAHLDSLEDDAYLLDEFHVVASGGSSGTRGVFVYDWEGWLQCRLMLLRFVVRVQRQLLGPDARPVLGWVAAGKATHMTYAMGRTFGGGGSIVSIPAASPLSEIVARLNDLRPDVLGGYPTMLYLLAGEANAGRLTIKPKMVRAGSEPLLPELRAALSATWDAPITNVYGTSEGVSASSCGMSDGMHLNEDQAIFEMVDTDGNPVPPGVRAAKMYVTNLYNHALPLIRYEMTDEATVIDGPCPCGSAMRRIADIEGRTDDVFTYPGALVIHPLTFRSRLGKEPAIVEYQVSQTERGATIAIRATAPVDMTAIARSLEADLRRLGLPDPSIEVHRVETFARQQTGKLRRFIPRP